MRLRGKKGKKERGRRWRRRRRRAKRRALVKTTVKIASECGRIAHRLHPISLRGRETICPDARPGEEANAQGASGEKASRINEQPPSTFFFFDSTFLDLRQRFVSEIARRSCFLVSTALASPLCENAHYNVAEGIALTNGALAYEGAGKRRHAEFSKSLPLAAAVVDDDIKARGEKLLLPLFASCRSGSLRRAEFNLPASSR